ncbi:hypothetical protein GCM10010873_01490 [Cypionkella aquatica]|uniref:Flagellar hook-length control protein-like C-terminal domain-containing protein n=1 Tax=Cypionkella aquatica TaxID=1756042 RepID=A0AA37X160_9RHOB|nr:flagellar hook-length control protein FliK [Cypionkella aquatica]GLS85176.1 hypothetical protein GCM10010873_01490 [Cypionkella aquatica]
MISKIPQSLVIAPAMPEFSSSEMPEAIGFGTAFDEAAADAEEPEADAAGLLSLALGHGFLQFAEIKQKLTVMPTRTAEATSDRIPVAIPIPLADAPLSQMPIRLDSAEPSPLKGDLSDVSMVKPQMRLAPVQPVLTRSAETPAEPATSETSLASLPFDQREADQGILGQEGPPMMQMWLPAPIGTLTMQSVDGISLTESAVDSRSAVKRAAPHLDVLPTLAVEVPVEEATGTLDLEAPPQPVSQAETVWHARMQHPASTPSQATIPVGAQMLVADAETVERLPSDWRPISAELTDRQIQKAAPGLRAQVLWQTHTMTSPKALGEPGEPTLPAADVIPLDVTDAQVDEANSVSAKDVLSDKTMASDTALAVSGVQSGGVSRPTIAYAPDLLGTPPPHNSNTMLQTMPTSVPLQLVQHLSSAALSPVEVLLSPEELGHVKFQLHQNGDTVRVVLSAERPETLDMLRRHSDQLLQEFRQAGFSQASLDFGQWSQRSRASPPPKQAPALTDETTTHIAPRQSHPSATAATGRGLNLRL